MPTRPRRVLVTGGCGYLGSRLIRELATDPRLGPPVVRILDNLAQGSRRALMDLPLEGRFEFIEADLLDPSAVRLALRDVDWVVHLAAVVSTPITFDYRPVVAQVNQWGTGQFVEACQKAGVEKFVFASTTAVYGVGGPFTESDRCEPLGYYAHSKLQAEESVRANSGAMEWVILRFGSLFGDAPVVRFDSVANRFVYLAGVGRALPVFGSGVQRRPLVHVRDAAAAIRLALAESARLNQGTWNAVAQNPAVAEIAQELQDCREGLRIRYTEQQVMQHLSMEVSGEAYRAMGWVPAVPLADGLRELLSRFGPIAPLPVQLSDETA